MATQQQIVDFFAAEFPHSNCTIEAIGRRSAVVRYAVREADLRPGGTVSGPALMATADVALYVAILGTIGIVPLTVTTSFNINFLRKPAAGCDIIAECKLLKVGKALVVGEVTLYSVGNDDAVAHAVGTYSIPKNEVT
ncbi:MAG: PaaI family thioesterase [Aeromicrobium sp.]|nr:PaaI family thioesterase [Burkholderiales bacterium]